MPARRFITRFETGETAFCDAADFTEAALIAAEAAPATGEIAVEITDAETGLSQRLTLDIAPRAPLRRRHKRAA